MKRLLILVVSVVLLQGVWTMAPTPASAASDCSAGYVALTYDDGPIPGRTDTVLAALDRAEIKATFFVVGTNVRSNPDTLRKVAAGGHVVANHTYGHETLYHLSDYGIVSTIDRADAAIRAAGVNAARLVRPPGGDTNPRVKSVIEGAGYRQVMWTWGPLDYQPISAWTIARGVINHAKDGAIIVLHDGASNYRNTAAATETIVSTLHSQGYCFGVLDARGNVVPAEPTFPTCLAGDQAAPDIDAFVIGGSAVISDDVEEYLAGCVAGTTTRLAGSDRYATAAALAAAFYPDGASTVYVATGENFPDALSAGPSAARFNAPLLLTRIGSLPSATRTALNSLSPERIIVIGGTAAISDAVYRELEAYAPVTRLAGLNRYATAAEVSRATYPEGVDTAFVVSGRGFYDALVAGSPAVHAEAPLLLTDGANLSPSTRDELARLQPSRVVIVGGTVVVSSSVEAEITALLPGAAIERLAGPSRYDTAVAAAHTANMTSQHRIFYFTESKFPDGLAAVAAAQGSPLLPVDVWRVDAKIATAISTLFE